MKGESRMEENEKIEETTQEETGKFKKILTLELTQI